MQIVHNTKATLGENVEQIDTIEMTRGGKSTTYLQIPVAPVEAPADTFPA